MRTAQNKERPYYLHLSKDPVLLPLLDGIQTRKLVKHKNICLRLCASIISQQLSTKVADVIFRRFIELYGGKEPTPQQIMDTPHDTLRAIGLSNAKGRYVHNVATHFIEHKTTDSVLQAMTDQEVIDFLTSIKGVGRWTAEMLLMFALNRPDVFPADDLGIMQGMVELYCLDTNDKKQLKREMLSISEKWSPFRTYACLYIWHRKDNRSR